MTKYIKPIRDLFEYALYKFTHYLLTYLSNPRVTIKRNSKRNPPEELPE